MIAGSLHCGRLLLGAVIRLFPILIFLAVTQMDMMTALEKGKLNRAMSLPLLQSQEIWAFTAPLLLQICHLVSFPEALSGFLSTNIFAVSFFALDPCNLCFLLIFVNSCFCSHYIHCLPFPDEVLKAVKRSGWFK